MTTRTFKILIVTTCIVLFAFCQKKLFKNVEAHGRLLNFFTLEPIKTEVSLLAPDASSAKDRPPLTIATSDTDDEGNFHFKTNASTRERYFLKFASELNSDNSKTDVQLKENENTDLGDFLLGEFTFSCQVTLLSVSGYPIDLEDGVRAVHFTRFAAGTNTQVALTKVYTAEVFNALNKNFRLDYRLFPNAVRTDSFTAVPINSTAVQSMTISY